LAQIAKPARNPLPARSGASLISHLLLLGSRWLGKSAGRDWRARTEAKVVEAAGHFAQAAATGPLIT